MEKHTCDSGMSRLPVHDTITETDNVKTSVVSFQASLKPKHKCTGFIYNFPNAPISNFISHPHCAILPTDPNPLNPPPCKSSCARNKSTPPLETSHREVFCHSSTPHSANRQHNALNPKPHLTSSPPMPPLLFQTPIRLHTFQLLLQTQPWYPLFPPHLIVADSDPLHCARKQTDRIIVTF